MLRRRGPRCSDAVTFERRDLLESHRLGNYHGRVTYLSLPSARLTPAPTGSEFIHSHENFVNHELKCHLGESAVSDNGKLWSSKENGVDQTDPKPPFSNSQPIPPADGFK